MLMALARNWWVLLLRGLLIILFGMFALAWPFRTMYALVILFGAFAIVDGIFAMIAALLGRSGGVPWWALLVEGALSVAIGVATFTWPGGATLVLVYMIAFWSIATGIFELVAAFQLRRVISGELFLAFGGVLSLLFGVLILLNPVKGAQAVVWLIGIYAILFGGMLVALSSRLRGIWKRHHGAPHGSIETST